MHTLLNNIPTEECSHDWSWRATGRPAAHPRCRSGVRSAL